ncbi:serine protease [Massilia sp. W12]|uniref:trypsin-like serine peptidase n=1 Tax=Massilia sp. W12 TaxID=3126507 RepID=UPI0030CBC137
MKFTSLCALLALSFAASAADVESVAAAALPKPVQVAKTHATDLSLAPEVHLLRENAGVMRRAQVIQREVSQPGADFIKVRFSHFKLPAGAKLTVSSPDGKEVYTFDGRKQDHATWDSAKGEDGRTSFSSMSVFGDRAIIKLHLPAGSKWNEQAHAVKIDSYLAGNMNPEEQMGTTSTCGVNERRDAVCYASSHPTEFGKSKPVARLLISGGGLCTTWRVGPQNLMLTNNHCISTSSATTGSEVWFNYQNTKCGVKGLGTVTKVRGSSMKKTSGPLDYTLFTVDNFNAISGFGYLSLDVRDAVKGERIYIPQHGAGNPKELAITSDRNTGGLCAIDIAVTGVDTGYMCDTIGGSSGSPVLAAKYNKVIALHHLGGCTNKGVLVKKIWPEISTFFGGVIP